MLGGRRFRYFIHDGYLVSSDADFCILGELQPDLKPEGPFGDHIGYYSDRHPFPFLKVKKVLCKKNAIYPFTVVGRPPQEDTLFGSFIHQITKPMVPASIPGLVALHAVDDAGVHPLCLALAHERFRPYAKPEDREPLELLKTANAILGFNQASLTKYLLIAAAEDEEAGRKIDVNDIARFFGHVLERIDFSRDLHFETSTSIDTLDYTGSKLNHGSKLTLAAAGTKKRELRNNPEDLQTLKIPGITSAKNAMPGVIVLQGPAYDEAARDAFMAQIEAALAHWEFRENYPWISIVDSALDSSLDSGNLRDFLWLTFTRSDPAKDVFGYHAQVREKHWGCVAPLMVDARIKPHHQKALTVPAEIRERARQILDEEKVFGGSK
jgi:4-hydroxy-3-polyprenylbenzoate decarboxylase